MMRNRLNILVTGSGGQLGSELKRAVKDARFSYCRFLFVDVDSLNICSRADVQNCLKSQKIDLLINCAAYTAVDQAESDKEAAFAVNADGVKVLADCCAENDTFLIHVSTDYVFDGTSRVPYKEDDAVNPTGVYGLSKRAGEEAMLRSGVNGWIIRTAWLYSAFGKNFVKTMLRLGDEKQEVHVVADQYGSPTWAFTLADVILQFILKDDFKQRRGVEIFHYTNEGECSWYEFAAAIMEMAGKQCRVMPIASSEFPAACRRPEYSVLDKSGIKKELGIEIPLWDECLRRMLDDFLSINKVL